MASQVEPLGLKLFLQLIFPLLLSVGLPKGTDPCSSGRLVTHVSSSACPAPPWVLDSDHYT